ncbi:MAG: DivIVA domain-containing protein [Velocimicrobium sp.]
MLTPVEMQGKELRQGRGYQKKDADEFLSEIFRDYESLYRENMELKDKVNTLSEGLNYYKDLEKTLQKTLIVAEKTAEETTNISKKKASLIISDAQLRANQILLEANSYFEKAQSNIKILMQQYENYRIQCKQLADANLELLNSDSYKVDFEMIAFNMPKFTMPTFETVPQDEPTSEQDADKVIHEHSKVNLIQKEQEKLNFKKERAMQLDTELFEFFNLNDDK